MPRTPKSRLIHAERDAHGLVQVTEHGAIRSLYFDSPVEQSRLYLQAPMTLGFEYQQHLLSHVSDYASQHPVKRTLTLGLGGGTLLNHLYCLMPKAEHHAVELRQTVIDIAYEFFYLQPSSQVITHCADAYTFLPEAESADIIIVDVYDQDSMPECFCEDAFLDQVRAFKKQPGLVLFNLWTSTPSKTLKVLQYWQNQSGLKLGITTAVSSGNVILSIQ